MLYRILAGIFSFLSYACAATFVLALFQRAFEAAAWLAVATAVVVVLNRQYGEISRRLAEVRKEAQR